MEANTAYQVQYTLRADGASIELPVSGSVNSLSIASENVAVAAWKALCNGKGMVDSDSRKVFNAARKMHGKADYQGSIYDALATAIERRVARNGKCVLRVDGLEYSVRKVQA